jgi:hypothetical protein
MTRQNHKPSKKRQQLISRPFDPQRYRQEHATQDEDCFKESDNITFLGEPVLKVEEEEIFRQSLRVLNETGIPYAVGSAFARHVYTGIWRETKDLDVFVKPGDLKKALDALEAGGFETEVLVQHWLAKARKKGHVIDLIFGAGHGQFHVDDKFFRNSIRREIVGVDTYLVPVEEMIAFAMFVNTRQRYDGSEVAHLIRSRKGKLDWERLVERLGEHRQLLLWHLLLFDYVYPGHSDYLPQKLMLQLFEEMQERWANNLHPPNAFRGTLIDPFSFMVDIEDWEYQDIRDTEPLVTEEGDLI